jgi:hypothetical protein
MLKRVAIAAVLLLLSASTVKAQDACSMTTSDGRTINLGNLCGQNSSSQPQVVSPVILTNVRIANDKVLKDKVKVSGFAVNQTSTVLKPFWVEYQLRNRFNGSVVAMSSVFIAKTIPPGGRVGFETWVDKSDVGRVSARNLVLEVTKIE